MSQPVYLDAQASELFQVKVSHGSLVFPSSFRKSGAVLYPRLDLVKLSAPGIFLDKGQILQEIIQTRL